MHCKTLKMISTSGFLTALECTKFVLGRGSAPDTAGCIAYSAPADPLAGLRGPTSKGRGGERKGKRGIEEGRGGRGMEGKGRGKGKYKKTLPTSVDTQHFIQIHARVFG